MTTKKQSLAGEIVWPEAEYRKIREYTELCPDEIACMGYATLDGNRVIIDEVFLVPQVISLGNVEFIETGLMYAVNKARDEERLEELRFCWHSHATHGAFFSGTDEDMVRKIRDASLTDWFASAVLNKRGDTHAQIDFFPHRTDGIMREFAKQVTVELDFTVEGIPLDATEQRITEIESLCTRKVDHEKAKRDAKKDKSTKKDDSMTVLPLPSNHDKNAWKPATARDWELHKKAKSEGWWAYVPDDVDIAYYWDAKEHFMGSAPIPLTSKGDWMFDVTVDVVDGSSIDSDPGTDLIPLNADDDEVLLEAAEKAGLL